MEWLANNPGWAVFLNCCMMPLIVFAAGVIAGRWSRVYRVAVMPREMD